MNISNRSEMKGHHTCCTIHWGSIFGGLVVALVILFMMNLLSLGLGSAVFSPDKSYLKNIGTGVLVWGAASSIISSYFGGWVAGSFSGHSSGKSGFYHGFIMSGVSIILMIIVMSTALGSIVGGTFNLLTKSLSVTNSFVQESSATVVSAMKKSGHISPEKISQKVSNVLPPELNAVFEEIKSDVNDLLTSSTDEAKNAVKENMPSKKEAHETADNAKNKLKDAKRKVMPALNAFIKSIGNKNYEQAKNNFVDVLSQASGKSKEDLEATVGQWENKYNEAKASVAQATEETAGKTANFLSYFALINFMMLLLGLIAACVGGYRGSVNTERQAL